jgi:hypothetical protein
MSAGQRRVPLLSAVTADATASIPIDVSAYRCHTVYLRSTGTTSGGNVVIEEADWDDLAEVPYGGTWSVINTIAASTFTGGAMVAVHLPPPSAYAWLRVRVSGAITGGGSVSASLRSSDGQ